MNPQQVQNELEKINNDVLNNEAIVNTSNTLSQNNNSKKYYSSGSNLNNTEAKFVSTLSSKFNKYN